MNVFDYTVNLENLASDITSITGSFNTFEKTVSKSQSNTQKGVGKTTHFIDSLENKLKKLEKSPSQNFVKGFKKIGQGVASLMGIADTASIVSDSFQKMETQGQAVRQVQLALNTTNGAVGFSLEELEAKALDLQNKTIFGDESILQNTTSQLLAFPNITGSAFDGAQQAALDITSSLKGTKATGEDLSSMSIMLGKALSNPVANLDALNKSGVTFTATQKDMIKGMAESGNLGKAQSLILGEIDKQYGGSAESLAENGLGALKRFQNAIGNIQEKIASSMLPFITPVVELLTSVFSKITDGIGWVIDKFKEGNPYIVAAATVIGVLTTALILYNTYTSLTTLFQNKLTWAVIKTNMAFLTSPIFLIITGIVALIAVLAIAIYKIKGWGEAWKHTSNGAKLIFEAFLLKSKADFLELTNGIMIGIDKIKLGWYKFKEAVGMGDSSENQKMIAQINADTEAKKKAITEAITEANDKALEVSKQADKEFKLAAGSLSWDKSKNLGDVKKTILGKLGVVPIGLNPTNTNPPGTNRGTGNNKTNKAIATGGTKHNYITLNINKEMIGKVLIKGNSFKESATQMEENLTDALLRTMALATTA